MIHQLLSTNNIAVKQVAGIAHCQHRLGKTNLPDQLRKEVAIETSRHAFPEPFVTDTLLDEVYQELEASGELGATEASLRATLDSKQLKYHAVPVIAECLQCGRELDTRPVKGRAPLFYRFGEPGEQGSQFVKQCSTCDIIYELDGYQLRSTFRTKQGVKLPYPRELRHPDWLRVSSQTYIHTEFKRYNDAATQVCHAGYSSICSMHNYIVMDKAWAAEPGQQPRHRHVGPGLMGGQPSTSCRPLGLAVSQWLRHV